MPHLPETQGGVSLARRITATAGQQSSWWIVLAVLTVSSLTLGQTMLSVVGSAPEFFIASRLSPLEIVVVALAVLLAPLGLALAILAVRTQSRSAAGVALAAVIGLLAGALGLYTLDRLGQSAVVTLTGAITVTLGTGWAYLRSPMARTFVRVLSPAPLIVLFTFVFASPTTAVIFADDELGSPIEAPITEIPIVLMIFDELPLTAIMDGSGALVFPEDEGFSRLARDGVWYRNAATISHQTFFAVPSIMTGTRPERSLIPAASDYPNSLFTALRNSHELRVIEPFTAICAVPACADGDDRLGQRLQTLFDDLSLILRHLITPAALSENLPPIDEAWAGFSQSASVSADDLRSEFQKQSRQDRRLDLARLITFAKEPSSSRPPLLFAHFLLPHIPWEFLSDGTSVGRAMPPTFNDKITVDDAWRISLGVQRMLHTVRFLDDSVARILDSLQESGLYEDALIIGISDHGASFVPGFHRRIITAGNMSELVPIPMFVKYPKDLPGMPHRGSIDDLRAETIDIVPTILDVLDVQPSYDLDGVSLLDLETRSRREGTQILTESESITYPADLQFALLASSRYDDAFPTRNPDELIPAGVDPHLIGTAPTLDDFDDVRISLRDADRFTDVVLEDEPFPALVTARVEGVEVGEPIGVLVNERLELFTQVYANDDGVNFASGVLPKSAINAGFNSVQFVVVRPDGSMGY